jgi:hypothetical protein
MMMQKTLKLKPIVNAADRYRLLRNIEQFNLAFNCWAEVQDATCYPLIEKHGLPASLAAIARDLACEAPRTVKLSRLQEFNL